MKRQKKADIHFSNSGSGFFGIHGQTRRGRIWIDKYVYGADRGEAWSDDFRCAKDIADGAIEAGLTID